MPLKYFTCPDGHNIDVDTCLSDRGCRMPQRCATRPYLRLAGYDREFRGISPSMIGNGPRLIYLKATTDYAANPQDRAFSSFGIGTHEKLSKDKYSENALTEELLEDGIAMGTADLLEEDEYASGHYILYDYKTFGSYKVTTSRGLVKITDDVQILDEQGNAMFFKSGKNKGKPKTKKNVRFIINKDKADIYNESMQLNRYRIMYEKYGFPISQMRIFYIVRDGGTFIAKNRGVEENIGFIRIPHIEDSKVLNAYKILSDSVETAFEKKYAPLCTKAQRWDNRRCLGGYCEVSFACKKLSEIKGEKWVK